MRKIFKILLRIFILIFLVVVIIAGYLFIGTPPQAKEQAFGVNFSQKHAKDLGLDWK